MLFFWGILEFHWSFPGVSFITGILSDLVCFPGVILTDRSAHQSSSIAGSRLREGRGRAEGGLREGRKSERQGVMAGVNVTFNQSVNQPVLLGMVAYVTCMCVVS